ncbi:MAG TPA: hypothetical protein VKY40_04610 [Halanaerobiales bacterium]|nr:hypothetical protein [Halanaerobiales bacterium]
MVLLEYMIRLLMGKSDTMFIGLMVVIFGYYGWLLWHLKDDFNKYIINFEERGKNLEKNVKCINEKIELIDSDCYKKMLKKIEKNKILLENLQKSEEDTAKELARSRQDIISAIKDSNEDIKEIMMILMNNRPRSINKKESKKETGVEE